MPRIASGQNADLDDLRARVERLEQENRELRAAQTAPSRAEFAPPQAPDQTTIDALVDQRLAEREAEKKQQEEQKKQEAAEQGYVIGSDLSAKARFKDGLFPWIETPHKDFTLHISCWTQLDNVWWAESAGLYQKLTIVGTNPINAGPAQGVASGPLLGGIGDLQDGVFMRRIRPNFEGTFWENGEYRIIPALENNQFNTAGIDEMWVGARDIPVVGTVRIGHVKTPMGLEADMTASSRAMTFMERSSYSEAIELNQNFVTGLWLGDALFDQRMTWSLACFRPDVKASTDAFFGDGQAGVQARLTGLPLYEIEGRHLLHVGLSGGWRNGTVANLNNIDVRTVQLSARPELRDDVPGGGGVPNSNSNRMVDTGLIASDRIWLMGLEALYIRGPLSLQAEYGWNWLDNAVGVINANTPKVLNAFAAPQGYMFNGGYAQLAYTLTGENRAYDRRGGTLAREYFGKSGPYNRAWIVRDGAGHWLWNSGAWEVACRYSYVNLNSGLGGPYPIQGGIMDGVSVGLNWYLNNNLTLNLDWSYDNRRHLPAGADAASTVQPGYTNGFGARVQLQF